MTNQLSQQDYEANKAELKKLFNKYLKEKLFDKHKITDIKEEDYLFGVKFYSYCQQHNKQDILFKPILEECLKNGIKELAGAIFYMETYEKVNAS